MLVEQDMDCSDEVQVHVEMKHDLGTEDFNPSCGG